MKRNGFTLIEVIVAISVFGIIGILTSVILINTVRSAKKAQIITVVRQNGQAALDQISRGLRGAGSLDTSILCDGTTKYSSSFTYYDLQSIQQIYTVSNNTILYTNGANPASSLLDSNTVLASNVQFVCTASSANSYAAPIVDISFDLTPAQGTQAIGPDGLTSPIHFQTSVVLRNLGE